MHAPPLALTLDLDDTLWPIWPTIDRAEAVLHDWLSIHAPATAARFDRAGLRALRDEVARERPDWHHDFSAMRHESLRRALALAGDDVALSDTAFDVFFAARQQVSLFDEVPDALRRLSARYPLLALTNGNSDLARIGLGDLFQGSVTARELGVAKPDARIFHEACAKLGCSPAQVLHIGDDFELDVQGALGAGLQAVWLRRGAGPDESAAAREQGYRVFSDLAGLADELLRD